MPGVTVPGAAITSELDAYFAVPPVGDGPWASATPDSLHVGRCGALPGTTVVGLAR